MSRNKAIPLGSIRLADYYINNFAEQSDEQAFSQRFPDELEELRKRRHLRAMQSKNFIERAVLKFSDLMHRLAG